MRAILESSVRLGKIFELNLVAEGVETQQDWNTIVDSGCDEVQGYFVAKPMSAAQLIDSKKRWERNQERKETMGDKASILVVDDDSTMQEMFDATLGGDYRIARAASGEAALAAVLDARPDVIILDVEMPPGMDGYETCRRLKAMDGTREIPVIFVSSHDAIDDRLKGYDAGGEDYITKPFDAPELEAKIVHLLRLGAERAGLKQMASYASSTAMTAMTSMSEMGALLESMKAFSACTDNRGLADAMLAGLARYGLDGAAQIRAAEGTLTRTAAGEASPLEASIISHMASMERTVQFKARVSITYPRVSLLVNDMPIDDPERCGRLRDHLAMLAEGAEARAEAIAATTVSQRRGATIERAVARIIAALADIDAAQRQNQLTTRMAAEAVIERMDSAHGMLALSAGQEENMGRILRDGIGTLLNAKTDVFGLQDQLSSIVQELKGMAGGNAPA